MDGAISVETKPRHNGARDELPLIDLRRLAVEPGARAALDAACREGGCFRLTGHGLTAAEIARLHAAMHGFFALPEQALRAIERSANNHWGYYDRELTGNRLDAKRIFDVGPAGEDGVLAGVRPQWPEQLPAFRGVIEAWCRRMHLLAGELLTAIAACLGAPAAPLRAGFEPHHSSFLRLNHYPRSSDPVHAPGIHPHTDAGALTLLLQDDVPGLQLQSEDGWHTVPAGADTLIVNIGDIVQVWSNERYRAPVHRVLGSGLRERYSAAYFYNPVATLDYAPLPAVCTRDNPPRYRSINWGAFRAARAAGDYADVGEEVQIRHFRHEARIPAVYRAALERR